MSGVVPVVNFPKPIQRSVVARVSAAAVDGPYSLPRDAELERV